MLYRPQVVMLVWYVLNGQKPDESEDWEPDSYELVAGWLQKIATWIRDNGFATAAATVDTDLRMLPKRPRHENWQRLVWEEALTIWLKDPRKPGAKEQKEQLLALATPSGTRLVWAGRVEGGKLKLTTPR